MKAIIYAGIGLFSVATVYGLADYYSSQKKGTLKKLYVEEKPITPVVEEKTSTVLPPKFAEQVSTGNETVIAKVKATKKLKRSANKKIKMEDFSRARIPEQVVEELEFVPIEKPAEVKPEKPIVKPAEKIEPVEVVEEKITLDKFSRAPLKKRVKKVHQQQQR